MCFVGLSDHKAVRSSAQKSPCVEGVAFAYNPSCSQVLSPPLDHRTWLKGQEGLALVLQDSLEELTRGCWGRQDPMRACRMGRRASSGMVPWLPAMPPTVSSP